MINSIKDLMEENRDMLSSVNKAIKLMLAIATNMSCVTENDIRKEESKDKLNDEDEEYAMASKSSLREEVGSRDNQGMTKRHSKESGMTRKAKVIGGVLDAETRIILSENVQNHRETRTKGILLDVLGVIAVTVYLFFYFLEIEMCTSMFKDQAEVVVTQKEVQEKIDLVENEKELIEEEEQ
nr:hypothetical protein [Tanacetum cinerariifolium]